MCARPKEILYRNEKIRLTATEIREGKTAVRVTSDSEYLIQNEHESRSVTISLPSHDDVGYRGNFPVLNLAYNLALQDLKANRTSDGLLKAGAAWNSVWTRDIAYAAMLGADVADPDATRRSLKNRVRDGVIVQDTGTGGGWPVSTDRVVWALGAWTSYLVSGGADWLTYCIEVIKKTLEQDAAVLRCSPLVPGETSFLDWREQSYPAGMSPAEIGGSYALSTNVLHCLCRRVLSEMLREAGRTDEAEVYEKEAERQAREIEKVFWMPRAGRYGMFCTSDGVLDPRADSLGTALVVLAEVAGQNGLRALRKLPRSPYGTPVFSPYKCDVKEVYHNRAIWPFVEAFVMLAHAKEKDASGVEFSMASLLRAALMNGTNKENLHALDGQAATTLQNSDSQLWSAAGTLAFFYRCLLGLKFEGGKVTFKPCIPHSVGGEHRFTNLRIRDMVLSVTVTGSGTEVESIVAENMEIHGGIPMDARGNIDVRITMAEGRATDRQETFSPLKAGETLCEPEWEISSPRVLQWAPVQGANSYRVYANGTLLRVFRKNLLHPLLTPRTYSRTFRVQAVGASGISSSSKACEYVAPGARCILPPRRVGEHAEYDVENSQAWLDTRPCTSCLVYESAETNGGVYSIRFLYCNASASLRDGDTCALRELCVDGVPVGVVSFPHNTEVNNWSDYTLTASIPVRLSKGVHTFSLRYSPVCRNGNGEVNQCMVRHLELTRLR